MKVQVSSYNEGTETWNAEAEETRAIHYTLEHRMNQPCEAWVIIKDDSSGTIAQKYNSDVNDNYLGTSKIYIEDPDGTDVFFGRIIKAVANRADQSVVLYCRDWLDQLDDDRIDYEMREDLDGSGLRVSSLLPDWDETDGVGGIRPAFDAGGGTIYLYDNHRILTADAHNGQFLTFTDAIAGKKRWRTGPYQKTTTAAVGIDTETGAVSDLWDDDDANAYATIDNDESWTADVDFRVQLGDQSGTINDNYVVGSMTGGRIIVSYSFASTVVDDQCDIQIRVDSDNNGTLDAYKTIGKLKETDSGLGSVVNREVTFEIPVEFFDDTKYYGVVSTGGIGQVRFNVVWGSGTTALYIYKIYFEVDVATTGMSDIASISDGETYRLTVNVDFADPSKKVWTGCTYSIAREIYKHIDSAESPGTLVTDGDVIQVITCAATIEHTSGVSYRQYRDMSRLAILQDLAQQDKAMFWITAGTATLNWKSTFNDDPVDETLTDAEILSVRMEQDYDRMFNDVKVYGVRIGDQQLIGSDTDATSIDAFNISRVKIETGTGLVSQYDCEQRAGALVDLHKDIQKLVPSVTLRGNTLTAAHANTIVLGDEITLNSSYLGVNDQYIVQGVRYESRAHTTTLSLHKRMSTKGLQSDPLRMSPDRSIGGLRKGEPAYVPPNRSDVL